MHTTRKITDTFRNKVYEYDDVKSQEKAGRPKKEFEQWQIDGWKEMLLGGCSEYKLYTYEGATRKIINEIKQDIAIDKINFKNNKKYVAAQQKIAREKKSELAKLADLAEKQYNDEREKEDTDQKTEWEKPSSVIEDENEKSESVWEEPDLSWEGNDDEVVWKSLADSVGESRRLALNMRRKLRTNNKTANEYRQIFRLNPPHE